MGVMQPGSLTPPTHEDMPIVTASTRVSRASSFSVFSIAINPRNNSDIESLLTI